MPFIVNPGLVDIALLDLDTPVMGRDLVRVRVRVRVSYRLDTPVMGRGLHGGPALRGGVGSQPTLIGASPEGTYWSSGSY